MVPSGQVDQHYNATLDFHHHDPQFTSRMLNMVKGAYSESLEPRSMFLGNNLFFFKRVYDMRDFHFFPGHSITTTGEVSGYIAINLVMKSIAVYGHPCPADNGLDAAAEFHLRRFDIIFLR